MEEWSSASIPEKRDPHTVHPLTAGSEPTNSGLSVPHRGYTRWQAPVRGLPWRHLALLKTIDLAYIDNDNSIHDIIRC